MKSTTTSTKAVVIDYNAILQELVDAVNVNVPDTTLIDATYLQAHRTIGICGPRQSGKTTALFERFLKDPDGLYVCVNTDFRKTLLTMYSATMTTAQIDRMITVVDILHAYHRLVSKGERILPAAVNTYIDGAGYVFERVRRQAFYQVMEAGQKPGQLIITVD
jgi:hypothetical protein